MFTVNVFKKTNNQKGEVIAMKNLMTLIALVSSCVAMSDGDKEEQACNPDSTKSSQPFNRPRSTRLPSSAMPLVSGVEPIAASSSEAVVGRPRAGAVVKPMPASSSDAGSSTNEATWGYASFEDAMRSKNTLMLQVAQLLDQRVNMNASEPKTRTARIEEQKGLLKLWIPVMTGMKTLLQYLEARARIRPDNLMRNKVNKLIERTEERIEMQINNKEYALQENDKLLSELEVCSSSIQQAIGEKINELVNKNPESSVKFPPGVNIFPRDQK